MSFLKDYRQLVNTSPRPPVFTSGNEDSLYVNSIHQVSNSYYCFDGGLVKDSAYCYFPYKLASCFDCDSCLECELCYQCADCRHCYACHWCDGCVGSYSLSYCSNCQNCHDCWGCVELRNKNYCVFNKQYTPGVFRLLLQKFISQGLDNNQKKFRNIRKKIPRQAMVINKSEKTPFGNHVNSCSLCYWIFDGVGNQGCAYLYQSKFCKDCFDCDQTYQGELLYQCRAGGFNYCGSYLENCQHCRFCHYLIHCSHCENCFGCVNLQHRKYCILNRQFTAVEYEVTLKTIMQELFS